MPNFKSIKREVINGSQYIISFMIQNTDESIILINEKNEIEDINEKKLLPDLGYSKKDLIGKNIIQFVYPNERNLILDLNSKEQEKNEGLIDFHLKHADGNWIYYDAKYMIFFNELNGKNTIFIFKKKNK